MSDHGVQYTEGHAPQTVAKQLRARTVWDVVLSIVFVVFANTAFLIGAIFAILSVGLSRDCSSGCDTASASSILFAVGAILALIGLVGSILTIVFLVRRRRGWWIAATTLGLIAVGWIVGFLLFAAALSPR